MQKEINPKNDSGAPTQANLARDNHFIPQMYQQGWSDDGKNIWEYKTLVHDDRYPSWQHRSITRTGVWKNLYVRVSDGSEQDDFEHMFHERFENPADVPLKKARNNERLSRNDWNALIRFICSQHVRTPGFFFSFRELNAQHASEALSEVASKLQDGNIQPKSDTGDSDSSYAKFNELVPVSLTLSDYDDEHTGVKIETTLGKGAWLFSIQHHLREHSLLIETLCSYKWSIVEAPAGVIWPTSDRPLVLGAVQQNGENSCVLGIKEANVLLFPISSQKSIITCPGVKLPSRFTASAEEAKVFRELILKNAFLYVYSACEDQSIQSVRPRVVDSKEAARIRDELGAWYDLYKDEEAPLLGREASIIDNRTKKN